jgi:hypothetical protein
MLEIVCPHHCPFTLMFRSTDLSVLGSSRCIVTPNIVANVYIQRTRGCCSLLECVRNDSLWRRKRVVATRSATPSSPSWPPPWATQPSGRDMTRCKLSHDDLACYGNTSAAAKGGDEMQPPGSGIPRDHAQPPHVVHRAPASHLHGCRPL